MGLVRKGPLKLITFDGDVTLYPDGRNLDADNPVISRILDLLLRGVAIGIVTAAGYTEAANYYHRLHGLLDRVHLAVHEKKLTSPRLVVLGGESQYLFDFAPSSPHCLKRIPSEQWMLDEMLAWGEESITALLDVAEDALRECIATLGLAARVMRKERAVGIIPECTIPGAPKLAREQLEETVLITQQRIEMFGPKIPFCAFNGEICLYYSRQKLPWLTWIIQGATTSLSTSATNRGACSLVSTISGASRRGRPYMLETSSCRLAPMISRYETLGASVTSLICYAGTTGLHDSMDRESDGDGPALG